MAKVTVTHQFDYYEERDELRDLMRWRDARYVLHEIDQDLRSKLKHGNNEWLTDEAQVFLEDLRSKIGCAGVIHE